MHRIAWTKLPDHYYDFLFDKEEFVSAFLYIYLCVSKWNDERYSNWFAYLSLIYGKFRNKINNFKHIEKIRESISYIDNIIFL
jgi:hypothetical protein